MPSKLIKLSCSCYVAAQDISEITASDHGVTVRMNTGIGHHVSPDYGKGVYDTLDRLVQEVNSAQVS